MSIKTDSKYKNPHVTKCFTRSTHTKFAKKTTNSNLNQVWNVQSLIDKNSKILFFGIQLQKKTSYTSLKYIPKKKNEKKKIKTHT